MSNPNVVSGAASGHALTAATLDACLENIKMFQRRYDDEVAKQKYNTNGLTAYNVANHKYQVGKAHHDNLLKQGHNAPPKHVWTEANELFNCSAVPDGGGCRKPFCLCGNGRPRAVGKCKACDFKNAGGNNMCNCPAGQGDCRGECRKYTFNPNHSHYQAAYNNWVRDNPPPVKFAPKQLIPISIKIECSVCSQSIKQGNISATSVKQGDIDQTMNCFNKKLSEAKDAAAQELADAKTAAEIKAASDKQAYLAAIEKKKSSDQMTMYVFVGIFIIVVILAYVAYKFSGDAVAAAPVAAPVAVGAPVAPPVVIPQAQ